MPDVALLQPTLLSRRRFVQASAAAGAFALYAGEIARHELEVVEQTLQLRNLPAPFHGYRIVQLSDIHLEEFTESFFLERIIRRVNSLAPDLIVLTGDYVSNGPLPRSVGLRAVQRCAELLSGLACAHRIAVLGNHDVSVDPEAVIGALEHVGIPVLQNRYLPVERQGGRLWLCGVEDPGSSRPDLAQAIPARPDGPVILLAHAPDYADFVRSDSRGALVDLMLAGHSHGGQVRLPFLKPMFLPPMGRKYVEGLFRFDHMQLYVNRGIGTVEIPFRLNCPPEITIFTLLPTAVSLSER